MPKNKKGKQKAAPPTPQNEPDAGLGTIPEDRGEWETYDPNAWPTAATPWGGGDEGEEEEEEEEEEEGAHDDYQGGQGYPQGGYTGGHITGQGGYPAATTGGHDEYAAAQGGYAAGQGGYPVAPTAYGGTNQGAYAAPRGAPHGGYTGGQAGYAGGGRHTNEPAGRGWDTRAPLPNGPAAFGGWGAWEPEAAPAPPPAAPAQTPRPRAADLAGGGASWRSWIMEASANGFKPPPMGPPVTGQPFRQDSRTAASRVAFARGNTVIPKSRPHSSEAATHALQANLHSMFRGPSNLPHASPYPPPAPQPPQQRLKKNKRRKDTQDQWDQNPQWDEEWEDLGATDAYQSADASQWDQGGGGGWDDIAGRQQYAEHLSNVFVPGPAGPSPYPMPSRTMAYASNNAPDMLDVWKPGMSHMKNGMDEYADLGFVDSFGEGLVDAERALFGRERKARDRIHWQFPHDKDPRVRSALEWMQSMSHGLGAFGLDKFLQTRERGALFVNAAYEPPHGSNEPAFDWLTYDSAKETRDRIIQESVGFYDPAKQVVVFVLLPSKTGNSVAMWRRKIPVPNSVRLAHLHEIQLAKAALRKEYPVWVDELTPPKPPSVPPKPAKKKRGFFSRLFHVFKIEW